MGLAIPVDTRTRAYGEARVTPFSRSTRTTALGDGRTLLVIDVAALADGPRVGIVPSRPSVSALLLAETPVADTEALWIGTLRMHREAVPGLNEYAIAGQAISLGFTLAPSTHAEVDYVKGVQPYAVKLQQPVTMLTGTTGELPDVPVVGTERLFYGGLTLRRVASAPGVGEYAISGTAVTFGFTITGQPWARYFVVGTAAAWRPSRALVQVGARQLQFPEPPLADCADVALNTLMLRRVAASPGVNEFAMVSQDTAEIWRDLTAQDRWMGDYAT